MDSLILSRISRIAGVDNLVDILSNQLSASDFNSLLMEVQHRRTENLSPKDLLFQFEKNRFVRPDGISPAAILACDQLAYSLLPQDFEPMALSPVSPLGTCSVIATVHQHKVLSAGRGTEVVADATNVLALEASLRRKEILKQNPKSLHQIKLCTRHRHVRTPVFKGGLSFAHFNIFGMITAGRDEGNHSFEVKTLLEHLEFHIRFISEFFQSETVQYKVKVLLTDLSNGSRIPLLQQKVIVPLLKRYPKVEIEMDQDRETGRGYYNHTCFKTYIIDGEGKAYELGDGGFTDWTQQYLSNKKERLLISGLGSSRMLSLKKDW